MKITLGHYRPWCFGATLALHFSVLVLPLLWMHLHSQDEHRVEIFLVQSQARVPAPTLTQSSSAKSARAVPQKETALLPIADSPISRPVATVLRTPQAHATKPAESHEEAEITALNSAAGAPPAELPRRDPRYIDNQVNPYPSMSIRLGEQGTVLLRAYIKPDGAVGEVFVMRSSGYARLDNDARRTVGRWKYLPARNGDVTVGAWAPLISYAFQFEEK